LAAGGALYGFQTLAQRVNDLDDLTSAETGITALAMSSPHLPVITRSG
jgi:hypothetical protein